MGQVMRVCGTDEGMGIGQFGHGVAQLVILGVYYPYGTTVGRKDSIDR